MLFTISLYASLTIFAIGLLYKGSTWFRYGFDPALKEFSPTRRVYAAIRGIFLTLFSLKILTLFKVFVLEVVLQKRILKESRLRWWMHQLIYGGFILLLLMHALDKVVTASFFKEYYPTLNPFLFLRNLFGTMILFGVGLAVYRRFLIKSPRLQNSPMDVYVLFILAFIMISGFLLEGIKITSYTRYQEMVKEYAGIDDEKALKSLEMVWVKEYGLVSHKLKEPFEEEALKKGRVINESCLSCHSRPQWAFLGFGASRVMKPIASGLDRAGLPNLLWHLHFLACFVGLAYLPFSKMIHILTGPLSLLANAVMDQRTSDPANWVTKQMMELDACTHCGACTQRCAVGIVYEAMPNRNILPSEKMASLKSLAAWGNMTPQDTRRIQEGLCLCTNCLRCTGICPVGINLQELWGSAREALLQKGYPEPLILSPLSLYRGLMRPGLESGQYQKPIAWSQEALSIEFNKGSQGEMILEPNRDYTLKTRLHQAVQSQTFSFCYNCKTCTNACPVMDVYDKPQEALGLLPHQIMQGLSWGLTDLVMSSRMLWVCLGCYRCQEQCPQGVQITDVFYQLKNLAINQVKSKVHAG